MIEIPTVDPWNAHSRPSCTEQAPRSVLQDQAGVWGGGV